MTYPEDFIKQLEDALPNVLKTILDIMNDEKSDTVSKVRAASIYRRLITEAHKTNEN